MRDVMATTAFWTGLAEKTDFDARVCESRCRKPAPPHECPQTGPRSLLAVGKVESGIRKNTPQLAFDAPQVGVIIAYLNPSRRGARAFS